MCLRSLAAIVLSWFGGYLGRSQDYCLRTKCVVWCSGLNTRFIVRHEFADPQRMRLC